MKLALRTGSLLFATQRHLQWNTGNESGHSGKLSQLMQNKWTTMKYVKYTLACSLTALRYATYLGLWKVLHALTSQRFLITWLALIDMSLSGFLLAVQFSTWWNFEDATPERIKWNFDKIGVSDERNINDLLFNEAPGSCVSPFINLKITFTMIYNHLLDNTHELTQFL